MSIEGVGIEPDEDEPAGWLQYMDGSWARVARDGSIGPSITTDDLLEVAWHRVDMDK
ncbi:hypothetical protein ACFV4K_32065 [Nocardia sp. NPDC059764]|uniref:hypothetical protein n=1 Tax=Nocardia sp. NPDC059764 TaxID=3346939 RepID=UPI00365EBF1D